MSFFELSDTVESNQLSMVTEPWSHSLKCQLVLLGFMPLGCSQTPNNYPLNIFYWSQENDKIKELWHFRTSSDLRKLFKILQDLYKGLSKDLSTLMSWAVRIRTWAPIQVILPQVHQDLGNVSPCAGNSEHVLLKVSESHIHSPFLGLQNPFHSQQQILSCG